MPLVSSAVQTDEVPLLMQSTNSECTGEAKPNKFKKIYRPQLGTSLHSLRILQSEKRAWMSRRTKKCLVMLLALIAIGCIGLIVFGYFCSGADSLCILPSYKSSFLKQLTSDIIGKPLPFASRSNSLPTFEEVVSKDFMFDIQDHDVMVFLHMQKTGGTSFGKHLVKDLELAKDCVCHRKVKKRCTCLRPGKNSEETWLFSRYSTGWKCGLHADWTELTSCVDSVMNYIDDHEVKRRYFYITFLREPIHRYLSEYRHVRRGATWRNTKLFCNGRSATKKEVPPCYHGEDWSGVTLREFLACKSNLAINRQTRMLADLNLVNCYNATSMTQTERDTIMLASAKANLQLMSFFGLTEFQEKSQYIFEETFNLKFNVRFGQYNSTRADHYLQDIDPGLLDRLRAANHLDIQLYDFAKQLLLHRYKKLKAQDHHFKDHFQNMGNVAYIMDDIDKDR